MSLERSPLGEKVKDALAARNHQDAVKFINDLVEAEREIDEKTVLRLHELLLRDIDEDAGKFRSWPVKVIGSFFRPPPAYEVKPQTLELLEWLKCNFDKREPIGLAAIFHHRFVCIHPFKEGNGRTARLLMNYILMRHKYPFITTFELSDRDKYLETLAEADMRNMKPFTNYVARNVESALDKNLQAVEKAEILSLAEASELSPYSQEYLSLLARKGAIGAFKRGRNWHITKDDLNRYVKSIEEKRERARLRREKKKKLAMVLR